jgi:hypothetical protein
METLLTFSPTAAKVSVTNSPMRSSGKLEFSYLKQRMDVSEMKAEQKQLLKNDLRAGMFLTKGIQHFHKL